MFGNAVPKKKPVPINLEDDDILTGILTEIDSKETSTNSSNISNKSDSMVSSSSKVKLNEAALVKEYMQSFSRNIKKKEEIKKDGNSSEEEMIERIFKPDSNRKSILDRKPVVIVEDEPEIIPQEPELEIKIENTE